MTLTCGAFVISLQNRGSQTVRLADDCPGHRLWLSRKEPHATGGWWPVSRRPKCYPLEWSNVRLKPGESTAFETRLISPARDAEPFLPGSYTLRASLALIGCTESPEGTDCLAPLEAKPESPSTAYKIDFQDPVEIVSNEITVESSKLTDLGKMSFSFEVKTATGDGLTNARSTGACAAAQRDTIDCTVFKFRVLNTGSRAVRYSMASCSDSSIVPEYRDAQGNWATLPARFWACTANLFVETPILPGGTYDGEFQLRNLRPGWDTAPLHTPGQHQIRFRLAPKACFASPDGRFCLTETRERQPVESAEITVSSP